MTVVTIAPGPRRTVGTTRLVAFVAVVLFAALAVACAVQDAHGTLEPCAGRAMVATVC